MSTHNNDLGAQVTGIDFSEDMIEVARKANPGVTHKKANQEKLPEEGCCYDIVIANYVVHHLPEPALVFAEAARVLKAGGRCALRLTARPLDPRGNSHGTF